MKKYFIAGMLVWAPLAITIWVMTWGLSVLDGVFGSVMTALMAILPSALKPALQSFRDLPGVGILIVLKTAKIIGFNDSLLKVILIDPFISLLVVIGLAYLSYHVFEKHFLKLKEKFK